MKKRMLSFLLVVCMVFTMLPTSVLAAQVQETAAVAAEAKAAENPFTDVKESDWFYDAVQYARVNGFFSGISATNFDPEGTMTRGMFVTVLGHMAGVDTTEYIGQTPFGDVPANMYYAPYVAWAAKHGVTAGTGEGIFSPDAFINREQMATLFVNYFEAFGVDYGTEGKVTGRPADLDSISGWAKEAALKLWSRGLLVGDGTNFNPAGSASRAQAAALCKSADQSVAVWYKEPGVPSERVSIDPNAPQTPEQPETPEETEEPEQPSSSPARPAGTSRSYLVEFALVDGTDPEIAAAVTLPENAKYKRGTKIEHLPAPKMQNGLLLSWYYDAEMTMPVKADDKVTGSLKLYAKMGTVAPASMQEAPRYITVQVGAEQIGDYTFKIKGAFDPDDLNFVYVSANNQELTYTGSALRKYDENGKTLYQYRAVSGGAGEYVISALWEPGQTYSIRLAEDSPAVFVVNGAEQTSYIRTLNVITGKEETLQLTVNTGMRYIAKDDENLSGMSDSLDGLFKIALDTESGETGIQQVDKTGSFTFTGEAELFDDSKIALQVGDVVAIYAGDRPDKRGLQADEIAPVAESEDPNGTVAYVEITAINGSEYQYKTADSEEVLFTPDILPVLYPESGAVSLASNSVGGQFTIPVADMTYTDDVYEKMGLDSQTKVEAGDFIMFYLNGNDGTLETAVAAGEHPYAKIVDVVTDETAGTYTIAWEPATETEVMAAMDIYHSRNHNIEQDDKVITDIENDLVQQAIESGFVDEAAEYLTALALETNGFKELSGDMDLSSYQITFEDGTPVDEDTMQLMAGSRAEITEKEVVANVMAGSVLQHFEDSTGLRAELVLKFEVEVDCNNDNKVTISFTAIFEQEVMLSINVSGGAVWKKAWIFPYIDDYQMNANLDVGTYTAIGITATAKTVRPDEEPEKPFNWKTATGWGLENIINKSGQLIVKTDEMIKNIGEEIEGLIDKGEHFLDMPTVDVPSVGANGTESAGSVDTGGLAEKYSAMMEDVSDNWIDIVRVEIFSSEGHVDPFHFLAFGISADFVVSATMHVTIGMTFNFGVAKRYAFSLSLFDRECTTETVDLEEAHYTFQFYVMGTIGVRAGVEFEIAIGLFSLKLDSVGISAEAGAYAQMWGYFYYELSWTKGQGKESTCAGALYIEIGIYLSIKFKAQLFSYDKLTYNPTLYENEWVLWSAGDLENVYDFFYPESPDDVDEEKFEDDEEGYEEEVAAITELLQPVVEGARTFTLSSDVFNMNYMDMKTGELHGSDFEEEEEEEEEDEDEDEDEDDGDGDDGDSKSRASTFSLSDILGDIFGGEDEEEEPNENSFPKNYDSKKANNGDADDEKYFIIDVGNEYFAYDPVDNTVTVTAPEGSEQVCEITITWKGNALAFSTKPLSRTVTIFWSDPANAKFITFDSRGGSAVPMITGGAGQDISQHKSTKMIPTKIGYTFGGWYEKIDAEGKVQGRKFEFTTMGDYPKVEGVGPGITLYANWIPNNNTKYTVEYYLEELNGKYVLASEATNLNGKSYSERDSIVVKTGTTDALAEILIKYFPGFVSPSGAELTPEQQTIAPDGSTVIKLYYKRDQYTTVFEHGDLGADVEPVSCTTKYCGTVVVPAMVLGGYDFTGFEGLDRDTAAITVTSDKTYTATWAARADTAYRAELYVEKADGSGYVLAADPNAIQHLEGTTGSAVDPTSGAIAKLADTTGLVYAGATVNGVAVSESNPALITTDGEMVIKLLYNRQQNDLKYMDGDVQCGETEQIRYGAKLTEPADPVKEGYVFDGWYTTADFAEGTKVDFENWTMPLSAVTFYAKWRAGQRSYTVNHYVQGTDGAYSIQKTDSDRPTTTGASVTIAELVSEDLLVENVITYQEAKVGDEVVTDYAIPAAGAVVIDLYYARTQYTLTWETDGGVAGDAPYTAAGKVYAEAPLTAPVLTKVGYTHTWTPQVADVMPAADVTYTAVWAAGTDTAYTVEHWQQNADDDDYTLVLSEPKTGTTGEQTAAGAKDYSADGFKAGAFTDAAIAADGSTVIQVKYDRVTYEVTFNAGAGTLRDDAAKTFRHGQTFAVTAPVREDYAFAGWFEGESKFEAAVVTKAMGLTAKWTAGAVNYTVNHYVMGTDGAYPSEPTFTESDSGILGSEVTLSALKKSDYEYANGLGAAYDADKTEAGGATVTVTKGMTVSIYYARKAYTLSWQPEGGTVSGGYTNGTVYYGAAITAPAVTKTGHTGGWVGVAATMPAENVTYTAAWQVNKYLLALEDNGGDLTFAGKEFAYGAAIDLDLGDYTPSKTGCDFVGWFDTNAYEGGNQVTAFPATMPAGNYTLYARWTASVYEITYEMNGGSKASNTPTTHTYGQTTQIPKPAKTGYSFAGWLVNGTDMGKDLILGATAYTDDIQLTATWTINRYTIRFDTKGGSAVADIEQDYNTAVTAPADPAKFGYTFAGWIPAVPTRMPAENTTVEAVWDPIEYSITYKLNGGSYSTELNSYTIETESQAFGTPARNEYSFVGWFSKDGTADGDWGTQVTGITKGQTGHITVYAKWEWATYSISYVLNGGENHAGNPTNVLISDPVVTVQKPTRQYYDFAGWTINGATYSADQTQFALQGNSTFSANWEKTKYTVTLDPVGGEVMPESVQVRYEETYGTLGALPAPTRTGFTFVGWFTEKTEGTQVTDSTRITGENAKAHTLYAHWSRNDYTLTYDLAGGAFNGAQTDTVTVAYGSKQALYKASDITRTGYNFVGWTSEEAIVNEDGSLTMPAQNVTVTAVWAGKESAVTFDVNAEGEDASVSPESAVAVYGDPYGTLPTPVRTGYDFVGWFTEAAGTNQVKADTVVTKIEEDHTLYAKWSPRTYVVCWDANGGVFMNADRTTTIESNVVYGTAYYTRANEYTYYSWILGCNFLGWNTEPDGTGVWIKTGDKLTTPNNHTLYAQYGYGLWLGDTLVTKDNCTDVFGDGKASYDFESNTLSLNGATIMGGSDGKGAIHSQGKSKSLTIKLTGKNVVANMMTSGNKVYGLYTEGGLTIDGNTSASLIIGTGNVPDSAENYAIKIYEANGYDVKFNIKNGCSVQASAGTGTSSYGIYMGGAIHMPKGTLEAMGHTRAATNISILNRLDDGVNNSYAKLQGSETYDGTLSSAKYYSHSTEFRKFMHIKATVS